jgi:hypothetical protein
MHNHQLITHPVRKLEPERRNLVENETVGGEPDTDDGCPRLIADPFRPIDLEIVLGHAVRKTSSRKCQSGLPIE